MSKWRIELHRVGRGRVSQAVIVEHHSLPDVEQRVIRECHKYLMSGEVSLRDNRDLTYDVLTDGLTVGKAKIFGL